VGDKRRPKRLQHFNSCLGLLPLSNDGVIGQLIANDGV
jgi:hypothetical protein